jgi:hypothetical protein
MQAVLSIGCKRDFSGSPFAEGALRGQTHILDARITPDGADECWIRVLGVPIIAGNEVVGLHGLKPALWPDFYFGLSVLLQSIGSS